MPKQQHPIRRCGQCGQWDNHPRVVFARDDWPDKHHDCLSAEEERQIELTSEHGAAIIAAAKSGIRGDKLRAHIFKLHAKKGGK